MTENNDKSDVGFIVLVATVWVLTLAMFYFLGSVRGHDNTKYNYDKFMRECGYMKYEITEDGMRYQTFLNVKTGEFEQVK